MVSKWKSVLALCMVLVLTSAFSPVLGKERVNMEFKQAPLVDVFQILGQLGGYNVLVDPSVSGQVSFVLNDLPVEEALDLVTRTTGFRYKLMGNTLIIASEARLKSEFGTEDFTFVSVENVDVKQASHLVSIVAPSVKSYVDEELNLVVLYGLTSDLAVAEKALKQYDRQALSGLPVPSSVATSPVQEKGMIQHTMAVRYADGAAVLELARGRLPQREFSWDEVTRQLTAWTTDQEWVELKALVQSNDLPKFTLNGILSSADQMMVLVEHRAQTTLMKPGDTLEGWTLTSISSGAAEFTQDNRTFDVRIGR